MMDGETTSGAGRAWNGKYPHMNTLIFTLSWILNHMTNPRFLGLHRIEQEGDEKMQCITTYLENTRVACITQLPSSSYIVIFAHEIISGPDSDRSSGSELR